MSTYLVAFIVSDFEHISVTSADGVLVSVYTQPGQTDRGQFALQVGSDVLHFFQQWLGERYPLPKLDMIAIPEYISLLT